MLIALESTDWFSASNTSHILYPIAHYLTGVDYAHFEIWNIYIRKVGHFVGYFGLSFLLFRSWRASLPQPGSPSWSSRWASLAFLMTVLVASLDEWHQTFIPSRTGHVSDVFLDASGALMAQLLLLYWLRPKDAGNGEVEIA